MEIRNIITFLQVAERKSFTKASDTLGYAQSTVSSQIKQLEDELGTRLFERINHSVELTESGRSILEYAKEIVNLSEMMKAESSSRSESEGLVRIAMAPSVSNVMLGENFIKFRELFPKIRIKIVTYETNEMLKLLNQNDADLIFIVDKREFTSDHIIASEKKVELHFTVAKNYPIDDCEYSLKALIENHPFILTEKGVSYRRLLDDKLSELKLEVNPILELGNTDRALELVELGAGVSFLPDYVTKSAYAEGKIKYIHVSDIDTVVWRQLLYHRSKWLSPAMKCVIDYCSLISEKI